MADTKRARVCHGVFFFKKAGVFVMHWHIKSALSLLAGFLGLNGLLGKNEREKNKDDGMHQYDASVKSHHQGRRGRRDGWDDKRNGGRTF